MGRLADQLYRNSHGGEDPPWGQPQLETGKAPAPGPAPTPTVVPGPPPGPTVAEPKAAPNPLAEQKKRRLSDQLFYNEHQMWPEDYFKPAPPPPKPTPISDKLKGRWKDIVDIASDVGEGWNIAWQETPSGMKKWITNKTSFPEPKRLGMYGFLYGNFSPELQQYAASIVNGPKPDSPMLSEGYNDPDAVEKAIRYSINHADELAIDTAAETLSGLKTLAGHPMETIKGFLYAGSAILTWGWGLRAAGSRGAALLLDQISRSRATGWGRLAPFDQVDLEDVYFESAKGMQEVMEFFHPGQQLFLGPPTKESEMAGEVIMAPLNGLVNLGNEVANSKMLEGHPNLRGAARFIADLAALGMMGYLFHGGKARKARKGKEAAAKVERLVQNAKKSMDKKAGAEEVEKTTAPGTPESLQAAMDKRAAEVELAQQEAEAAELKNELAEEAELQNEFDETTAKIYDEKKPKPKKTSKKKEPKETTTKVYEEKGREPVEDPQNVYNTFMEEFQREMGIGEDEFYEMARSPEFSNRFAEGPMARLDALIELGEVDRADVVDLAREYAEEFGKDRSKIEQTPEVKEVPRSEIEAKEAEAAPVEPEPEQPKQANTVEEFEESLEEGPKNEVEGPKPVEPEVVEESRADRYHRVVSVPAVRAALEAGKVSEARAIYNSTELARSEKYGKMMNDEIKAAEGKGLGATELDIEEAKAEMRDMMKREKEKPGSITENDIKTKAASLDRASENAVLDALKLEDPDARIEAISDIVAETPEGMPTSSDVTHSYKNKRGKYFFKAGETWYDSDGNEVTHKTVLKNAEANKKPIKKTKAPTPQAPPESVDGIEEVDSNAGEDMPKMDRKFRTTREVTQHRADVYKKKGDEIYRDPFFFVQKLLNDVNRWLDGDNNVDIAAVRNALSELAARLDEVRGDMDDPTFMALKGLAEEGATWARRRNRSRAGGMSPSQLNSMIPLDKIPDIVRAYIRQIKKGMAGRTDPVDVAVNFLYRNLELWKNTGMWLGKDGKWRYELDSSKAKIKKRELLAVSDPKYLLDPTWSNRLGEVIDYSELFDTLPGTENIKIRINYAIPAGDAVFYPKYDLIEVSSKFTIEDILHELQHRINAEAKSKFVGTSVEEQKKLHPEGGWLTEYFTDPGEMEGRLASARRKLFKKYKGKRWKMPPPWETLEQMLDKEVPGRSKASVRLYSGDPAIDIIVRAAQGPIKYVRESMKIKEFKPLEALGMAKAEFIKAMVDRTGNVRADLLSYGLAGWDTVRAMYLAKGANSLASHLLHQMRKEVYGGLSKEEKTILDTLILTMRMDDIAHYKSAKQFAFPEGLSPRECSDYIVGMEHAEGISLERGRIIRDRADAYFEWMKKAVDDLYDAELIDATERDELKSHNYRAIRGVDIADLYDNVYEAKIGTRKRTIYDSGVQRLAKGKGTDIYERSSEIMALEVFNRIYGRILNNKANQNLAEVARSFEGNDLVRLGGDVDEPVTRTGLLRAIHKKKKDLKMSDEAYKKALNDLYGVDSSGKLTPEQLTEFNKSLGDLKDTVKESSRPKGWSEIYYFEGGKKKSLYISPELAREWVSKNSELSYRMSQFLRLASGSAIVRTFATGINWGFALANVPRDVMHAWFAARTFENGKWKPVYNPNAPIFAVQMARDMATVSWDAFTKTGRYEDYIRDGGGMEFLTHSGRLFQRGRHLGKPFDGFYDFMGYFGETSEVITRLAIRERALRKAAKKLGLTLAEARQDKTARSMASFVARDYLDFGQGGYIIKTLDNVVPYLSATIQGSRGLFRTFIPGQGTALSSSYKLFQLGAAVTGVYLAARAWAPNTMSELEGNIDDQNNLIIPLGDNLSFLDREGQRRYIYLKVPLDQGQKFFKQFFIAAAKKYMGDDVDLPSITGLLKALIPVDAGMLPPSLSGPLGYTNNRNFWLNRDIFKGAYGSFDYPASREEYIPGVTPQMFIDLGQATDLSPERSKYLAEEFATRGPVMLLGKAYEVLMGSDYPDEFKGQYIAMLLDKAPVLGRFIGITNPYSKHAEVIKEERTASDVKEFRRSADLNSMIHEYLFTETKNFGDVMGFISKNAETVEQRDNMIESFKFQIYTKNLPERSFWNTIQRMRPDARARVFIRELEKIPKDRQNEIWRELGLIQKSGGTVVTPDFMREVREYYRERRQGQ